MRLPEDAGCLIPNRTCPCWSSAVVRLAVAVQQHADILNCHMAQVVDGAPNRFRMIGFQRLASKTDYLLVSECPLTRK